MHVLSVYFVCRLQPKYVINTTWKYDKQSKRLQIYVMSRYKKCQTAMGKAKCIDNVAGY